jgi:tetratricopeptide (TPR) repeat protein
VTLSTLNPRRALAAQPAAPPVSAFRRLLVDPTGRSRDLRPILVFLVAYAVRFLHVLEMRRAPFFDVPLVDGPNYFRTAATIASGSILAGHEVFWQPPLYPYFLALLFVTVGTGMTAIYLVQAALGSLSCALVYLIGRRLFGQGTALWSGVLMAFYGPLVHFDAQPLVPVLHIVLVLGGLLMLLRNRGPGAGLLWGLAATATPNILLVVPAATLWQWRSTRSARMAGLFALGVALPVAAVCTRNLVVAGEPVLISSNGGINLYIGNNADYDRTIRLRPGGEFERLAQEPLNLGIVAAGARSRYFAEHAWRFVRDYPGEAARLYVRKAKDLVAGREIQRNEDTYSFRRESSLLALLLWRHGVSFPFGVVAPLALAGLVLGRRDLPDAERRPGLGLLLLYGLFYALSILIFFPTDRYRLPLVPVLALLAGLFLASLPSCLRRPLVIAALVSGLVLFNLDAFRASESYPEEEALNWAYALRTKGRLDEARDAYLQAIALNPRRIDAYNSLALMAAEAGHWQEAVERYNDVLSVTPDFADIRRSLGEAYLALGRTEDARREWQTAIQLAPGAGLALADLCLSYYDEGNLAGASSYCERAVEVRPDLPETHLAMGLLARAQRQRGRAREELTEAARLFPPGSAGRGRAQEILDRMRHHDERAPAGITRPDEPR